MTLYSLVQFVDTCVTLCTMSVPQFVLTNPCMVSGYYMFFPPITLLCQPFLVCNSNLNDPCFIYQLHFICFMIIHQFLCWSSTELEKYLVICLSVCLVVCPQLTFICLYLLSCQNLYGISVSMIKKGIQKF